MPGNPNQLAGLGGSRPCDLATPLRVEGVCSGRLRQCTMIRPCVVLTSMFSGIEVQFQARLGVRLPLKGRRSA